MIFHKSFSRSVRLPNWCWAYCFIKIRQSRSRQPMKWKVSTIGPIRDENAQNPLRPSVDESLECFLGGMIAVSIGAWGPRKVKTGHSWGSVFRSGCTHHENRSPAVCSGMPNCRLIVPLFLFIVRYKTVPTIPRRPGKISNHFASVLSILVFCMPVGLTHTHFWWHCPFVQCPVLLTFSIFTMDTHGILLKHKNIST
jgi:hypothetical protein